jgi:tetratricopeptide (TPR) repeat protein
VSSSPLLSLRSIAACLAFAGAVLLATADDGATEHVSALGLRLTAVIAVWALWPRSPGRLQNRHLLVPGAALLLLLAALPFSQSFGPGLQAVLRVGFVCLVFLLSLLVTPTTRAAGFVVFAAVAVIHALWAVGQRLFTEVARGTGGFFSPNDLAACLAPLLVMALGWASDNPRRRRMAAATAAILGLGLLASSSRSGLLAAAAGSFVLARGSARKLALAAVVTLAVTVVATPSLRERFAGRDDAYSFSRVRIWTQAAKVAWRSPLGVGLGGFEAAMRREGVPLDTPVRYPKAAANAHSELMYAWVELGWLGLALVCLPAIMIASVLRRQRRAGQQVETDAAVLVAFAIPALVSTSLHIPLVAYLAAWWAGDVASRDDSCGLRTPPLEWGRVAACVLGLGLLSAAGPDAVAHASLERSAALRDRGQLDAALRHAERAALASPWSAGAAVMVESLRFARGDPPLEVADRLLDIAEDHPTRSEPLMRAAVLLETTARNHGDPALWALAAVVRERQLERDPFNALAWVALGRARQDDVAATAAFERAVQVEPRCAQALAHLAADAARSGHHGHAEELAAAARAAHELATGYRGYPRQVLSLDPLSQIMLGSVTRLP